MDRTVRLEPRPDADARAAILAAALYDSMRRQVLAESMWSRVRNWRQEGADTS